MKPFYLEVSAEPRYWEDAWVNGEDDDDGVKIPLRQGDNWCPIIDLKTGCVLDWPQGTTAKIHYKVCDQGQYWLLDENKTRIGQWSGEYVPDEFLCVGDTGFGDYIILKIGSDGLIEGWKEPKVKSLDKNDEDHSTDWIRVVGKVK